MNISTHLFLTGYRGTGKSTVGRLVAAHLRCHCIDLDDAIESRSGKSIREIFEQGGEGQFRHYESLALEDASAEESSVIALGGGAILSEQNRDVIARTGWCCWLDADAETILGRLRGDVSTVDRRPALTNLPELEEIRDLLKFRRPLYQEASDCRINVVGQSPEQIAREVLSQWRARVL